jgi:hypothetical protein
MTQSEKRKQVLLGWSPIPWRHDGGLGHSEQPLDGLTIRPVTQFVRELEYARRAEDWHVDLTTRKFVEQEK